MRPQHLVFALVMAAAAGTNWVASKIAVDTLPPLLTVAMRFAILSIALSPFARVFKGQMVNVFLVAVTLGVVQFGFMFRKTSQRWPSPTSFTSRSQLFLGLFS
jgi:drug/metabolite transporter (DMT)-like permease